MVCAHGGLKAAAVTFVQDRQRPALARRGPAHRDPRADLPANEPGSSIIPGKVDPARAVAMLMAANQVIASDVAVTTTGGADDFELNAFRPILISSYLHSTLIMADMCGHFRELMIEGIKLNKAKLTENIDRSVMMVTALSPIICHLLVRHRSHPNPPAGLPGQRRQRGPVRPGRRPARVDPPRLGRYRLGPQQRLT
jgi:fumarate hydratase class II